MAYGIISSPFPFDWGGVVVTVGGGVAVTAAVSTAGFSLFSVILSSQLCCVQAQFVNVVFLRLVSRSIRKCSENRNENTNWFIWISLTFNFWMYLFSFGFDCLFNVHWFISMNALILQFIRLVVLHHMWQKIIQINTRFRMHLHALRRESFETISSEINKTDAMGSVDIHMLKFHVNFKEIFISDETKSKKKKLQIKATHLGIYLLIQRV